MPDLQLEPQHRRALLIGGALAGTAALVLAAPGLLGVSVLPPCPFLSLTGFDCPLCGGTRATRALLTGDVGTAVDYNILVPLMALTAVLAGVWWLVARWSDRISFDGAVALSRSRAVWITVGVAVVLFWVLRNLPALTYFSSYG